MHQGIGIGVLVAGGVAQLAIAASVALTLLAGGLSIPLSVSNPAAMTQWAAEVALGSVGLVAAGLLGALFWAVSLRAHQRGHHVA